MSTLYLIPTPLGRQPENHVLPEYTLQVVRNLRQFIVENIRTSQSFLQWVEHPLKPYEPEFRILNRKTPAEEIFSFVRLLENGDVGLMSEAGAPAVADPGMTLVRMVHDAGHRVIPLTGPSSILLALMASGMNGQSFSFHGYLPRDEKRREERIRSLERSSAQESQTQIFIETPFRNNALLNTLLTVCQPQSRLAVAADLTLPEETIISRQIHRWREAKGTDNDASWNGRPAVFLLSAD